MLSSAEPVAGVSSFAYQGTNAHVIAAIPSKQPVIFATSSRNWKNQRYWYQVTVLDSDAHSAPCHADCRLAARALHVADLTLGQ